MPVCTTKPFHDAVPGRAVVDAERRQTQEVADVFRRLVGRDANRDVAERGLEHGRHLRQRLDTLGRERRRHLGGLVADDHCGHASPVRPARPCRRWRASEIRCATRSPSLTRPNTVCWPSSAGWSTMQMKNCVPPLSGRPGTITADTAPRVCFSVRPSRATRFRPPVPAFALVAGIFRERIAALHDALAHHAVERRAGQPALADGLDEEPDVIGRVLGQQVDHDLARRRREHRLLAAHLVERERRAEERRAAWARRAVPAPPAAASRPGRRRGRRHVPSDRPPSPLRARA